MNVLFYASGENGNDQKYQLAIESVVPVEKIEVFKTVSELSQRLRQPVQNLAAVVLLARNSDEFSDFLEMRDLLSGLRLILVLPNQEEDIRSEELALFPSYVSYIDQDVSEVAAVLNKIVGHEKWNQ